MRRRALTFRGIQSAVEQHALKLARSFPQEWYDQPDWQPARIVRAKDGTYALEDRNRLTLEAIQSRGERRRDR